MATYDGTIRTLVIKAMWKLCYDDSGYSAICQAYQSKAAIISSTHQSFLI